MLSDFDLEQLCMIAMNAANNAGQMISHVAKRQHEVLKKSGGSTYASQIVTEVDIKSQQIILDTLAPTIRTYDFGLLCEESNDDLSRLQKEYFWCVDPLDGTLPFVEGKPGYSVSIALVNKQGEPIIGVVYNPIEHDMYHAIRGKGAFLNGENIRELNTLSNELDTLWVFRDRSFKEELLNESLQNIALKMGCKQMKLADPGGAVMNACWALHKGRSVYFKAPKLLKGGGAIWDFAATVCIYKELSRVATQFNGQELSLNQKETLYMNQGGVIFASDKELAELICQLNQ